jgi:hypothetical protein
MPRFASQVRTRPDLDRLDAGVLDGVGGFLVDELAGLDEELAVDGVVDVLERDVADDAVLQRLDDVLALLQRGHLDAEDGAAIVLADGDVLGHVHEAARQVAGVGRLQCRVGQALPRAVRGDEVLQHREPLTEVALDGALDDLADAARQLLLGLGHQAAHTGELAHLVAVTTGAGVHHHEHRVEALVGALEAPHHGVGHVVVGVGPGVDDLVVALAVGDDAVLVGAREAGDLLIGLAQHLLLLRRDCQVHQAHGDAAQGGIAEAEVLEPSRNSVVRRRPTLRYAWKMISPSSRLPMVCSRTELVGGPPS